ncbi:MAG: hypothetical protein IPK52_21535 [Chloroflexi bacterium]|nr:hypothetical protein [Chloroflexota bacterium]
MIDFAQKGVGWRPFNARREAFRKAVERRALRVLGAYPPRRSLSRKFRWSNDPIANAKARRWFFANYPDGYSRTGELGRAWKVALSVTVAGFSVSVGNPAKGRVLRLRQRTLRPGTGACRYRMATVARHVSGNRGGG